MHYLTKLFFFTVLLGSSFLFGQDDYSNQDWKALNSYINQDNSKAISQCRELLKNQSEGVAKNRTKFILARVLMETGKYKEALKLLAATQLDAAYLKSGIPGLMGDCKSEQGKYTEALDLYTKAFHAEWNEGTTPRFLFKAFLCAEKLGKYEEGQQFIRTIQFYFPEYAGEFSIEKYVIDDASLQFIELDVPTAIQPAEFGIGTINGKRVSLDAFYKAFAIAEINAEQQAQQQGQSPQPVDGDRVWASFVEWELQTSEHTKLEFHPNDEEFMAYLMATDGFEPQAEFLNSPAFTHEDGSFAPKKLLARIDEMRFSDYKDQIEAWANTKEYYTKILTQEKHQKFVFLTMYSTKLEVDQYITEEQSFEIDYRVELYRDIPDSEIEFTTEELQKLYESKKQTEPYQVADDYHELVYIEKTVQPNVKDTSALNFKMEAFKKSFQKTKDDSLFVVSIQSNALKFYTSGPYSTAVSVSHKQAAYGKYITYPDELSSVFEEADLGDVIGPYDFNEQLVIAKVIGRTDENIEARHILIDMDYQREGAEEEALAFLKTVTNENFGELATQYSQDTGSAGKGGNLGTFFFGDMVPPFATYCADAPIGEIGLVQTQFGYHIVQVTKRSGRNLPRLAIIAIPFEISEEATQEAKENLEEIRKLYIASRTNSTTDHALLFNSIATSRGEIGKISNLRTNSLHKFIDSELLSDSLVRFGFDSETKGGDISAIYIDSNVMTLAVLSRKVKAGPKEFESAVDQLSYDLIIDKKADLLLEQIKKHTTAERELLTQRSMTSLEEPRLSGGGFEPYVVGQAIRAYNNGQSEIYVKGFAGVYYVKVLSTEESTPTLDIEEQRDRLDQKKGYHFNTGFRRHLLQSNVVIDNRDMYRLDVRK